VSDGAMVSALGIIGFNNSAASNSVTVTDAGSRWLVGNTLYVGSNGGFNRLVINNGAKVISTFVGNSGILGQTTNSSSNLALVTGAGSLWSNVDPLTIGFSGASNQLVVSNGARVHSVDQCYVGLASSSDNNRVAVSGPGSLWTSDGGINLGLNGVGNRLSVRDGAGCGTPPATSALVRAASIWWNSAARELRGRTQANCMWARTVR
jgi:fibronectin-binding autotransporter adhesin